MEGISKDTFSRMDVDSKLGVLYDYVHEIHQSAPKRVLDRDRKCAKQIAICYGRFKEIESECDTAKVAFNKAMRFRIILNSVGSVIGGFIGGWSAVWASFKLGLIGG